MVALRFARVMGFSAVLVCALASGGCATSNAPPAPAVFSWFATDDAVPAQRVAVEMEDDGLPAQTPPPRSIRHAPDDPSQPWSRNYGVPVQDRRADAAPAHNDDARFPRRAVTSAE